MTTAAKTELTRLKLSSGWLVAAYESGRVAYHLEMPGMTDASKVISVTEAAAQVLAAMVRAGREE